MTSSRWTALAVTTALTSGLLVGAMPSPASAAGKCRGSSDEGNRRTVVRNYTKVWKIKQSDRKENYSGRKRELTFTSQRSSTETNKVAGYAEASAEAGFAWGKLQGKVGGSLEDIGTDYTFKSFTEKINLGSGDVYIYSRGARRYRVTVKWQECNWGHPTRRGWITYKRAKATGWDKVDTWVGCKKNPPKGTYSRWVKKRKC